MWDKMCLSGDWNFRQCLRHLNVGHLLTSRYNFTEMGDRPKGTRPSDELNTRGIAEDTDFGPIERYISEKVQDRS